MAIGCGQDPVFVVTHCCLTQAHRRHPKTVFSPTPATPNTNPSQPQAQCYPECSVNEETHDHPERPNTQSLVRVSAGLNALTDTVFLILQALDPETHLPPTSGDEGSLPPNIAGFEGQALGYFEFSVEPDHSALLRPGGPSVSGVSGRNRAKITFNTNAPLFTNDVVNIFDAGAPFSSMSAGPLVGSTIPLSWTADDTEVGALGAFEGSGVATYDVAVSTVGSSGPWSAFLSNAAATSADYHGLPQTTYWFKVEASDRVGNKQLKSDADLTVTVPRVATRPAPR